MNEFDRLREDLFSRYIVAVETDDSRSAQLLMSILFKMDTIDETSKSRVFLTEGIRMTR